MGRSSASTSRAALENADIVVGKSRAALDAMACGRAVYLYDMFGGDGWVTPDTYAAMEADQFAGQATDRVIGVEGDGSATWPTTTRAWARPTATSSSSITAPGIM